MASSARIDELRKKFDENPRRYFAPLANEFRKVGDLEQAIFICQEYLPQQPGHMSGHIVYGQALFESSRFDEARAVFETALSLDPENLIALRHLGDIARQLGDAPAARQWYQRVLEADPRNEEIAQIMATMLEESATPTPDGGRAGSVAAVVVDDAPSPVPTGAPPANDTRATAELAIEQSVDAISFANEPPPIPASTSESIPEATSEGASPAAATAGADDGLLDLGDLGFGSPAGTAALEPAEPAVSAVVDIFAVQIPPAEPAAGEGPEAEPHTEPHIELATDLALGLADDTPDAPSSTTDAPVASLAGLETFDAGIIDVTETRPSRVSAMHLDAVAYDATGDLPTTPNDAAASAPIDGEHDGAELAIEAPFMRDEAAAMAEPPAPDTDAFVTETMAELYLQQGHLESALDVYSRLVERHPDDTALGERRRAVYERLYGPPETDAADPAVVGPTIREFLLAIFQGPPPSTEGPASAGAAPSTVPGAALNADVAVREPMPDDVPLAAPDREVGADEMMLGEPAEAMVFGEPLPTLDESFALGEAPTLPESEANAEIAGDRADGVLDVVVDAVSDAVSDAADVAAVEVVAAEPAPRTSGATVSGSIDALFGSADAPAGDDAAATVLAEAFASDDAGTTPLEGVPAHRAPDELSLDHVFKTGRAPRDEGADAFSFDQFFSQEAAEGALAADDVDAGASAMPDDIAQFNAWLNGLKKT